MNFSMVSSYTGNKKYTIKLKGVSLMLQQRKLCNHRLKNLFWLEGGVSDAPNLK